MTADIDARVRHERELLARLQKNIDQYETKKGALRDEHDRLEHPGLASMLEHALIEYLDDALPPGLRIGEGTGVLDSNAKTSSQIDVVVDFDGMWSACARVPRHLGNDPVYVAAIEVRYRGQALRDRGPQAVAAEAMEVVRRLQELNDRALNVGQKCQTSAVLMGPGFDLFTADGTAMDPAAVNALAVALRAFYEPKKLTMRHLGEPIGWTWPHVDMLVLPGVILKKHTLFTMPERVEHPGYMLMPSIAPTILRAMRPLSTAKGFLRHWVTSRADGAGFDAPAWSDAEEPIYSPEIKVPPIATPEEQLAALQPYTKAIVLDGAMCSLYHRGAQHPVPLWFEVRPSVSSPATLEAVGSLFQVWDWFVEYD